MHTRLLKEEEIIKKSRKSCEDIKSICDSSVTMTKSGYHNDPVQTLLMRRGFNCDPLIIPIIESAAIQAEKNSAGAGELFLRIFSQEMLIDISRKIVGLDSDNEWEKILKAAEERSIPARKRDFERIFSGSSRSFKNIMKEAFELMCADDKIYVKKSPSSSTSISRDAGYSFENLGVDPRFLSRGAWNKNHVRVVLIDGIIEKVSEIHFLLEEISQSRAPCVIFCLDALPEVYETLIKNFLMGNLDVILVTVPIDEKNINTLADLGKIFEITPINSNAGEIISSGIKDQTSRADSLTIVRGKLSIERKNSRENIRIHVNNLRRRIENDISLAPILEPRIRNLSSSTVRINVGMEDQKKDPNIIERLDRTFRSLPKIIKSGFIEKNDFKEFSSSKIDLLFNKNNVEPTEMASQAIKIFLSTRKSIRTAGAGIETIQNQRG